MAVTEMTVFLEDTLLIGSLMIPLEHSYSSFKTQFECHAHCKPAPRHLNLSFLPREAPFPPLSSFFLYLRLLKQMGAAAALGKHLLYTRHGGAHILCILFAAGISPPLRTV